MASGEREGLSDLLTEQEGVISAATATAVMGRGALRWRVTSGKWQRSSRGVLVAHSGPIGTAEQLRAALEWAGKGAALAGVTAAGLDGLAGFPDERIYLLVPVDRRVVKQRPEFPVVLHRSAFLTPEDIHPVRRPRRTRIARSLVDAAAWMATDRGAMAVLAAGVQQRLVRAPDLAEVVARNRRLRRRRLIREALDDIQCGAQALSELDFTRLVVRPYRLPEPDRQVARRDSRGQRRYLDAAWLRWRVAAEIDGAAHLNALDYWDDMDRDNELTLDGYRTLRFPAFLVRDRPGYVAKTIAAALREAGWRRGGG